MVSTGLTAVVVALGAIAAVVVTVLAFLVHNKMTADEKTKYKNYIYGIIGVSIAAAVLGLLGAIMMTLSPQITTSSTIRRV